MCRTPAATEGGMFCKCTIYTKDGAVFIFRVIVEAHSWSRKETSMWLLEWSVQLLDLQYLLGVGSWNSFSPKRGGIVAETLLSAECRRLGTGLNRHCRRDMQSTAIMGWMLMFLK